MSARKICDGNSAVSNNIELSELTPCRLPTQQPHLSNGKTTTRMNRWQSLYATMTSHIGFNILLHFILPLSFIIACCQQFDALSLVNVVLLLVAPSVPLVSRQSIPAKVVTYLKACVVCTVLAVIPPATFQVVLASLPPYGQFLTKDPVLETVLRHVGLISLANVSKLSLIFYVSSRLLPALMSLIVYRECRTIGRSIDGGSPGQPGHVRRPLLADTQSDDLVYRGINSYFVSICLILCLAGAAILKPCLPSALYLLLLLLAMSWWACGLSAGRGFAYIYRLFMVFTSLHLLALYAYQLKWFQDNLEPTSLPARLSGLVAYRTFSDKNPVDYLLNTFTVDVYLYPLAVYMLYYFLNIHSRNLLSPEVTRSSGFGPSYGAFGTTGTSDNAGGDDTAAINANTSNPSQHQHTSSLLIACWSTISGASFVITYLVMMYWSIKYHSWPTLLFLLWALVVAVVHNPRSFMHKSVGPLLLYAQLLLLGQYIFCLQLNDTELPTHLGAFAMRDLFYRAKEYPCMTLGLQLVFVFVFWLTLRQYVQERRSSLSTPSQNYERRVSLQEGLLKRFMAFLVLLLVRTWIVLLAVLLFIYGIGQGESVTIFQIVYMTFFLFFVSLFQLSFRLWRHMLFGFVTFLIIYQMVVLVSVYLYQFKQVPVWLTTVGISDQWQKNIGLQAYDTKQLFINLLFPAVFMVVCVIYAQHVHTHFMAITNMDAISRRSTPAVDENLTAPCVSAECAADLSAAASDHTTNRPKSRVKLTRSSWDMSAYGKNVSKFVSHTWRKLMYVLYSWFGVFCRLLEIHSMKLNVVAVVLAALIDVCATHVVLVFSACVLLQLGTRWRQRLCSALLLWISVLVLLRTVYQLEIIDVPIFIDNCTEQLGTLPEDEVNMGGTLSDTTVANSTDPVSTQYRTSENATDALRWLGVQRRSDLLNYLTGYIAVIVVFTLHKCAHTRATFVRRRCGIVLPDGVVFVGVTRSDADRGLIAMLKYLTNYGFYKFGVEICLIALVAVVGSRLDVISLFYVLWLCTLFSLRRGTLARVWPAFVGFIVVSICFQYVASLGLPPVFCIDYPYIGVMSDQLREWLFLPDYRRPLHSDRLFADTLLLVLVFCQKHVFSIEVDDSSDFPGGSNKPVTDLELNRYYVNPLPDYNLTNGCYLSVLKRAVFFSSFWVTLALMCLAGINQLTLLSLFYVVVAFVFLWMGNDFYLLSYTIIRKRWFILLTYNVIVIMLKTTVLHLMGCLYRPFFERNAKWLIQLLGAGCPQNSDLSGSEEEIGILLDGIVFACLILQLRFFSSHYFQHLVEESRAQQILANCGAELIRVEQKKKMLKRRHQEERAMADIQSKMERIKEQRLGRNRQKHNNHYSVIHSCAAEDLEMDLEREHVRRMSMAPAIAPADSDHPLSPAQLITTGWTHSLGHAARQATHARTQSLRLASGVPGGTGGTGTGAGLALGAPGGTVRFESVHRRRHTMVEHSTCALLDEESAPCISSRPTASGSRHSTAEDGEKTSWSDRSSVSDTPLDSTSILSTADQTDGDTCNGNKRHPHIEAVLNILLSWYTIIHSALYFIVELIASLIISLTLHMNHVSEDYRFIARQLRRKKLRLKEAWLLQRTSANSDDIMSNSEAQTGSTHGGSLRNVRLGPVVSYSGVEVCQQSDQTEHALLVETETNVAVDDDNHEDGGGAQISESKLRLDIVAAPLHNPASNVAAPSASHINSAPEHLNHSERREAGADSELDVNCHMSTAEQLSSASWRQILEQLALACWYTMVSRSELLAYILVFINQMMSASVLSLPLPLMVFFWGSLSVPRPSKTFWVTMIAYVEATIIIKYMFQFSFFPQNQVVNAIDPFWPPRILGIDKRDNYALFDFVLLLVIFFHRMVLKSLGLWKDATDDETKNMDTDPVVVATGEESTAVGCAAVAQQLQPQPCAEDELGTPRLDLHERGRLIAAKTKNILVEGFKFYVSAVTGFFRSLLCETDKNTVDVYALMFLCDFINIFVIFLGFSSFGPPQGAGGGDISSVVEENNVPAPFLIILSLNFLLILLDRGIYLRKSIGWKTVFQYFLVVLIHGWLFFILPAMTGREFNHALAPRIWYFIKCIYLLFSALQIRSGYPTRILGNFLMKHYTTANKFAFKGFMLIPFLYELRALMDWLWTKTSLDIFNWVKMEDIYAHMFNCKCQRVQEESEMYKSGEPRRVSEKCMFGGCWLLMIVLVIFAPLVLFALSNAVGIPNPPAEVSLELSMGTYEPLFRIKTSNNNLEPLSPLKWDEVVYRYRRNRQSQGFLSDFSHLDVTMISLSGQSTAIWAISPPAEQQMIGELKSNESLSLLLSWSVKRSSTTAGVTAEASGSAQFDMPALLADGTRNPARDQFVLMLDGNADDNATITLHSIFPKFLRVTNQGKAELPPGLEDPDGFPEVNELPTDFRNLTMQLIRDKSGKQWWKLNEDRSDGLYEWLRPHMDSFLSILMFSQRAFPSTLSFFTGAGIIGTYTTFVLVIGRLCRSSFVDVSYHIMFDDMPYVDRILQICEDIYLVRERGNLILEEELFAKLIFLYRSPEMLIKYTEPPPSSDLVALPSVSPEVRRRLQDTPHISGDSDSDS